MHRPSVEVLERFGLPSELWDLARSQIEASAQHRKTPRVDALAELGRLARLGSPGERHTQDALRSHLRRRGHATRTALAPSLDASPAPGSVASAREAAFRKGLLPEETEFSLEFRRLFPGTDIGIYLGTHSMGLPSSAAVLACLEHLMDVAELGIASWDDGILPRVGRQSTDCSGERALPTGWSGTPMRPRR